MLSSLFFLLFLILTQLSNCATRRPSQRILLLARHRVKIGESRVAYGSPSANTSTQASDRASATFDSDVNFVCFTRTPPSVACIDHVSQMRNLSHNDTLALAASIRALIADGTLDFDSGQFDKEALALACLAHDGGGWMPYDEDCAICNGDCEQMYSYLELTKEICEKLFCPPKRSSLTETIGRKIYNRSVIVNTVLSTHIVNVTMQDLIISKENTWQLNTTSIPPATSTSDNGIRIELNILNVVISIVVVIVISLLLFLFVCTLKHCSCCKRGK